MPKNLIIKAVKTAKMGRNVATLYLIINIDLMLHFNWAFNDLAVTEFRQIEAFLLSFDINLYFISVSYTGQNPINHL